MKQSGSEPSAVDGGFGWIVLSASFINQVILLGYVKAAGVLFVEWQEYFHVGSKEVGWVGIILAFCGPLSGLIAGGLTPRFGSRPVSLVGGVTTIIAIAVTSFSSQLWHVYALSTVTAIGLGLAFQPSITVVGFYFKKRINIANGVAFSGVGAGIIVVPPLLQFLCNKFQWRGALLICGALMLITVMCALLFRPTDRERYFMLKSADERKANNENSNNGHPVITFISTKIINVCNYLGLDLIWRYPRFGMLALSYSLAGFGYYSSVVFFSSRAVHDAKIPKQDASFLVSAIGVGSLIGRAGHGFLIHSKIIGILQLYVVSGFVAAVSCFLNPLSKAFLSLLLCALSFGLFSGALLAVSLMCARLFLPTESISRSFGVLILVNGLGIVFGTFTMGYLNDVTGNYTLSFISAGIGFMMSSSIILLDMLINATCRKQTSDAERDQKPGDADAEAEEEKALRGTETEQTSTKEGTEVALVFGEEKKCMIQEPETSV